MILQEKEDGMADEAVNGETGDADRVENASVHVIDSAEG
jgi:hypothetical protein